MAYFYVASSWRASHHEQAVELLRGEGNEVYDYRNPPGRVGFRWADNQDVLTAAHMSWVLANPDVREAYLGDLAAIRRCDGLLSLQPYGLSSSWQLGYATALCKPTAILWLTAYRRDVMLAESRICADWDEVRAWAREVASDA